RQRVLHGAPVQARVHDAAAVVGEGDAARFGELRQLGQLLAAQAARDGADGVDAHHALDLRLGADVVGDRAVVVHGVRVRQAAYGGEPARSGGPRTGCHGLLVFVARLAQVHVDIDEARADDLAARVDDLGAGRRREVPAEPFDLTLGDQDVLNGVEVVRRIDDAAAPQQEAHAPSPPFRPARRSGTPLRTATPRDRWSRMTEYGPSATSGDSSTPRFTGPGCMISTSGRACFASRSRVSPQYREYSRSDGIRPAVMRSCCRRSIMITSTSPI